MGLYSSIDFVNQKFKFDLDAFKVMSSADKAAYITNKMDNHIAIEAIGQTARIAARWVASALTHDVTNAKSFSYTCREWAEIQQLQFVDGYARLLNTPMQQTTYATGMCANISTTNAIRLKLTELGRTYDQGKYIYWRITDGNYLLGQSLTNAALVNPLLFAKDL